jgi:hypothetical protein
MEGRVDIRLDSERPWQADLCQFFTRERVAELCLRHVTFPKNLLSIRLLEPAAGQGAYFLPLAEGWGRGFVSFQCVIQTWNGHAFCRCNTGVTPPAWQPQSGPRIPCAVVAINKNEKRDTAQVRPSASTAAPRRALSFLSCGNDCHAKGGDPARLGRPLLR